jgi:hypothetical protein
VNLDVEHFRERVLQDALTEATRSYWLQRAETFEAAKPRLGEYHGAATNKDLRDAWRRCDRIARACRARAEVSLLDDLGPEIRDALREVA